MPEFVLPTLPACTKRVRIILRIPASGNRITKKPATPTKRKPLDTPETLAPTEDFKMPETLNRPKPLKALKVCKQPGINLDLAEMRSQVPKPPIKVTQHSETAGVPEFVRSTFPACTKRVRIILRIPASGNRITKKPPTSKKRQPLGMPETLVPTEDFKMPATQNLEKTLKAPRTWSPETPKVKESQPILRRSPRAKNSRKASR
ncbi:hypothetical protein HOY80DRAFT_996699 [Tuber brumale]|nr:hypothetical protein HOY80DRAFT_996699 [Tuber brumale]